jgi:hypothetical protein
MTLVMMQEIYQESTSKHRHQQQAFHLQHSIDILMANPTKVKYDVSDDDECESNDCRSDDNDEEYTKEELMDMCEQVHT